MKAKVVKGVTLLEVVVVIVLLVTISGYVGVWLKTPLQGIFAAKFFNHLTIQADNAIFNLEESLRGVSVKNIKYTNNSIIINNSNSSKKYWCDLDSGNFYLKNKKYASFSPQLIATNLSDCSFGEAFQGESNDIAIKFELHVGHKFIQNIKLVRYFYIPYENSSI